VSVSDIHGVTGGSFRWTAFNLACGIGPHSFEQAVSDKPVRATGGRQTSASGQGDHWNVPIHDLAGRKSAVNPESYTAKADCLKEYASEIDWHKLCNRRVKLTRVAMDSDNTGRTATVSIILEAKESFTDWYSKRTAAAGLPEGHLELPSSCLIS